MPLQLAGVKEGRLSFVEGLLGSWLKAGGQHCQFVYRKVKPREDCEGAWQPWQSQAPGFLPWSLVLLIGAVGGGKGHGGRY